MPEPKPPVDESWIEAFVPEQATPKPNEEQSMEQKITVLVLRQKEKFLQDSGGFGKTTWLEEIRELASHRRDGTEYRAEMSGSFEDLLPSHLDSLADQVERAMQRSPEQIRVDAEKWATELREPMIAELTMAQKGEGKNYEMRGRYNREEMAALVRETANILGIKELS